MRLIFAALLLAGCPTVDDDTATLDCDAMAYASVQVDIVDLLGDPLAITSLSYSVDGGEAEDAFCDDGDSCSTWIPSWEQAGVFDITASYYAPDPEDEHCWYTDVATAQVTVTKGLCHVETQMLTIQLDTTLLVCE